MASELYSSAFRDPTSLWRALSEPNPAQQQAPSEKIVRSDAQLPSLEQSRNFLVNTQKPRAFNDRTPNYPQMSLPTDIVDEFKQGLRNTEERERTPSNMSYVENSRRRYSGAPGETVNFNEDRPAPVDGGNHSIEQYFSQVYKGLNEPHAEELVKQYYEAHPNQTFEAPKQVTTQTRKADKGFTKNAEPAKKKGLTQAQMKSRIEASAYANDDPNKWGLNGKMPQGWGVVKKSNGEVVVTPPSESNFWGDPEAEKAWRAAEANRKMGLWSMEKTMDPTASLKERQLAADIYDMRLRQQAAAVQKGLDPRAQALAEQRMHEGYVNQGRNRLEGMFNNLVQMEPDEAKRAQLLYNMNSTLGRDRRLWMKNGQPIMNLTDLDERIPLIADYMRALYENWKATGVWETDLSRIKGDHTLTDRFWQLFSNVPQTPHGVTLDGSYTQIPMLENRRVNNLIQNTQEYNDKRGLRE